MAVFIIMGSVAVLSILIVAFEWWLCERNKKRCRSIAWDDSYKLLCLDHPDWKGSTK